MLPFGVTIPATVPQRSEIPEGLMNYPVFIQPYSDMLLQISSGISAVGVSNNNSANKSGLSVREQQQYDAHVQLHQFSGLQCKHAGKLKVGKT